MSYGAELLGPESGRDFSRWLFSDQGRFFSHAQMVAYTNISHQPLVAYWEFLALAIAVVCVITKWPDLDDKQFRFRLIWTQTLHWIVVLIAMNIMLMSGVQQLLPTPATSLVLLTLLALGTFLAGLSLREP